MPTFFDSDSVAIVNLLDGPVFDSCFSDRTCHTLMTGSCWYELILNTEFLRPLV